MGGEVKGADVGFWGAAGVVFWGAAGVVFGAVLVGSTGLGSAFGAGLA